MDSSSKELQGPRPTPLKVRKDSHKIRKPPLAPPPHHHQQQQQQPQQPQQQPRPPVIIYTVSPKVIHTHPGEFMNLVQRLTGSSSTSSSSSSSSATGITSNPFNYDCGAVSPAARYATVEKANNSPEGKKKVSDEGLEEIGEDVLMDMISTSFPGILSPGPASLQPISPSFFSAPSDPNWIGSFFHDLSPAIHGVNSNFMPSPSQSSFFHDLSPAIHGINSNFMPSPSQSSFLSPHLTSPSVDLFNNFFDL
ncbi:protein MKS1-like [Tripterygium wilfordii]|uniref:Protein MKS1-like n=1 Tax=Tripterygium wilfordii TaxID=458696 RepID=A0A7J7DS27_TRIWF|nr:nuclear speckle RNA-binding protein B [Tripterygium wilfordii]KAF5749107.1 protein MKS1-like [Tripterygium wilfordii]